MAIAVSHQFVSAVADGADTSLVRPSDWNASHSLTGLTTGRILFAASATAIGDDSNFTYSTTSGPRLQVGSGATTDSGLIGGYAGASTFSGLWHTNWTPSNANGLIFVASTGKVTLATGSPAATSASLILWNDGEIDLVSGGATKFSQFATAGKGIALTAGTATTDVNALSIKQTMNAAAVNFTGAKWTFTEGASGTGSSTKLLDILYGTSGAEASKWYLHKTGVFYSAPMAYSALPTGVEGMIANVNDSNTATWGATVAGGGSNKVLVRHNGTNWTVAGA